MYTHAHPLITLQWPHIRTTDRHRDTHTLEIHSDSEFYYIFHSFDSFLCTCSLTFPLFQQLSRRLSLLTLDIRRVLPYFNFNFPFFPRFEPSHSVVIPISFLFFYMYFVLFLLRVPNARARTKHFHCFLILLRSYRFCHFFVAPFLLATLGVYRK